MKRALHGFILTAGLAAASLAQAGGPLEICNAQAVKYAGAGTVTLNYDGGGTLGARSKAQADAIVTNAVSLWGNVPTATVSLQRGADLPVDVTTANYSNYFNNFSDGLNPVIYDTDGSIVDTLLGVGMKNSVLGFAGSGYSTATCQFAEGRAVINGFLNVSDATMSVVLAHEVGHMIGLDHTQLDNAEGLATTNYPLMYPIAYRSTVSLHEDDASAITALYPDTNVNSVYGELTGFLRQADGVTPVRGANVWAQETTTRRVYSVVSDYLMQGNGFFRLLLPAGSYTLHAEAIRSSFTGGSSVGPYSEAYPTSVSFQPPLYVSGTAMAPVTLAGGAPFPITAGCRASATFNLNGAGSVTGNCLVKATPTVSVTSSANPSSANQSVTFTASVAGSGGTPSGTVTFADNGGAMAGCSAISLVGGSARCSTSLLALGSHSIAAQYSGDGAFNAASGAFTQTVQTATISSAGVSSLITHYYQAILRRNPDPSGQAYWEGEASRMVSLGASVNEAFYAMAMSFFSSSEYASLNRDNTGFLTDLYQAFFNRAPDAGGLAFWAGQIASGMPRDAVLASFLFSPEFATFMQTTVGSSSARAEVNMVMDFYRGVLGRLPDSGGFTYWLGLFRTAQCQGPSAVYT
ncbi:MAG TPA: DUF4214 domain-containing protein, partial [Usitatibacter sp.]|nr:DUF4214 domain-containing protein [Usitatibacter sp.]